MRSPMTILAMLILLWVGPPAFGENAWITVDERTEKLEIGHNMEWQVIPAGPTPPNQEFVSGILNGWQRGTFTTTAGQWFVYRVSLASSIDRDFFLRASYTATPDMRHSAFLEQDGKRTDVPSLDLVKPIYRIPLKKGKNVFYGIFQPGEGLSEYPLVIYSIESYVTDHPRRSVFNGMVYGVAITMFFYNLCMYAFFKKIYFLYYCLYVGSFTIALMYGGGHLPPIGALGGLTLPIAIASLYLYLFKSSALSLKRHTPKLYTLYTVASFLNLGVFFYCAYISVSWGYAFALVPVVVALGLACTVMRAIQGYRPAYFFILGWSFFLVGNLITILNNIFLHIDALYKAAYVGFALEVLFFSFATSYKARLQETEILHENEHAFNQLQKVFYPHQIAGIRAGAPLEKTMPTGPGKACVIAFDIIGSSTIKHVNAPDFFRNVFRRCYEIMMEHYDGKALKSKAYRIKEMGDGFLCSVGYPFQSPTSNMANDALALAEEFVRVLKEEAEVLHSDTPICCGIGMAIESLSGFYPEAGTKEYDLYGPAIVLATRYEGMRKVLFQGQPGRDVLIIHEKVYHSIDRQHRARFSEVDLKAAGIVVRDDPAASKLFYRYLDEAPQNIGLRECIMGG